MMILKSLENWMLPVAMLLGAIGYPVSISLPFLTLILISAMLLFTFCKASPYDLKPRPLHLWLLLTQILGSLAVCLLLYRFNKVVVEGVMVCVICPTAAAAAVVTSRLGGGAASLTTHALVANIEATVAVPISFLLIEADPDISFMDVSLVILSKVFPLLVCPFLAAWFLQKFILKAHRILLGHHELTFYLWGISLAIITAQTIYSLTNDPADGLAEIMIVVVALITCYLQSSLGKTLGSVYNDRISGGQTLRQKNTILTIWMAHTCSNLLSAAGPGGYVLWQNTINSWQLWKRRKNDMKQRM